MMTDFETALELARHAKSDEAATLREEGFRRQSERIEKRQEETRADQAETSDLLTAIIASGNPADAARLKKLDQRVGLHQNAVIEALQDNQERLDAADLLLRQLLDEAYTLPDGRRVFKSEDGTTIIDEHGVQVGREDIDPDMIDNRYPTAETWLTAKENHQKISQERAELVDYQNKLDQAQTLIDQGGLSDDDFADLDALMTSDVPDAVRSRLPSDDPANRMSSSSDPDPSIDSAPAGFDLPVIGKNK